MKGALKRASKLPGTDPIKRNASYFRKCTGSNKRTDPINRPCLVGSRTGEQIGQNFPVLPFLLLTYLYVVPTKPTL